MNQWRREIGAIVLGLLVLLFIGGGLGWYWHIALLIGGIFFGLGFWLIPKPRPPRHDQELVEDDLTESLAYASDKISNIRKQLKIARRPLMNQKVEAILAEAENAVRYARSLGTADPINIGLLKTFLEMTEKGVVRAARVSGSNSTQAQARLQVFENESLPELENAMGQVNGALASGEILSLDLAMKTIRGTISREGLNQDQLIPNKGVPKA